MINVDDASAIQGFNSTDMYLIHCTVLPCILCPNHGNIWHMQSCYRPLLHTQCHLQVKCIQIVTKMEELNEFKQISKKSLVNWKKISLIPTLLVEQSIKQINVYLPTTLLVKIVANKSVRKTKNACNFIVISLPLQWYISK